MLKQAVITSILKKPSLDINQLKNYRPYILVYLWCGLKVIENSENWRNICNIWKSYPREWNICAKEIYVSAMATPLLDLVHWPVSFPGNLMLIIYVKVLLVTLALGLDSHLFSLYNTLVLSYIMMAFYLGVMLLEVLFTEFYLYSHYLAHIDPLY